MTDTSAPRRDKPWMFRTYAGHSTAAASNKLYRSNLAKGQTGLSIAFDLPTQTGYDSDHILSRGEVGKVGVPVSHLGDMRALFEGIPLGEMNTSMTINATAATLLALTDAGLRVQAGTLTGAGSVAGVLFNSGTLNPGASPGLITGNTFSGAGGGVLNLCGHFSSLGCM